MENDELIHGKARSLARNPPHARLLAHTIRVSKWKSCGKLLITYFPSISMQMPIFECSTHLTSLSALLLLLLVNQTRADGICGSVDYFRMFHRALKGHVIKQLPADSEQCLKKCARSVGCFSINTYKDGDGTQQCELLRSTKTASPQDFVFKSGYDYYEVVVSFG